jgi:hypothetical protein
MVPGPPSPSMEVGGEGAKSIWLAKKANAQLFLRCDGALTLSNEPKPMSRLPTAQRTQTEDAGMALMDDWKSQAHGLIRASHEIFATAVVPTTENTRHKEQFTGLTLLARTASNLKGALILLDNRRVVEARVLARCCIENALWMAGLATEGDAFIHEMLSDDAHHRRGRGERLFARRAPLDNETSAKLRARLREIGEAYQNPTQLNPGGVAKRNNTGSQIYIFYEQLSADAAHPSVDALNRYVVKDDEIEAEPDLDEAEIVETLEYLSMAVLGVCFGVNDLLGGTPSAANLNGLAVRHLELSKQAHGQGSHGQG